jgi:hypothetical protein
MLSIIPVSEVGNEPHKCPYRFDHRKILNNKKMVCSGPLDVGMQIVFGLYPKILI